MYFNLLKIAFLLSLINVNVFQIALCENFTENATIPDFETHDKTNISSTRPVNETRIQDKRFRRATNFGRRHKCGTSSQCTGKDTSFEKLDYYYNCYCDNACYETFQDCCSDFVKTCGEQKKTNTKNSQPLWKCLAVGKWDYSDYFPGKKCRLIRPSGIWMIANCSRSWPLDETRTRCGNAPKKISFPVEDFLPVVGKNGFTYRNKHCAECNGEKTFQTWDVVVRTPVIPPKEYNLDAKLRFVLANGGSIKYIGPLRDMPWRVCSKERYVDSCSNTSHSAYQECLNGPVEPVTGWLRRYFKNKACALCNGETATFPWQPSSQKCGQSADISARFSIVYDKAYDVHTRRKSIYDIQEMPKICSEGLVYDDILKHCRQGVITNIEDTLSDVFLIILSFESGAIEIPLPFPILPNI